jgi:hypothetical protein
MQVLIVMAMALVFYVTLVMIWILTPLHVNLVQITVTVAKPPLLVQNAQTDIILMTLVLANHVVATAYLVPTITAYTVIPRIISIVIRTAEAVQIIVIHAIVVISV